MTWGHNEEREKCNIHAEPAKLLSRINFSFPVTTLYVTSSAILDLINMHFDSSMIFTKKMVENVKLRQIIAKSDFSRFLQQ